MPTPTMSDEELDALFRRGAEAYPDDMPPEAWARMETKLDEDARTRQLRRKVGRFFAGELLLLVLLLWQAGRLLTPATAQKIGQGQPGRFSGTALVTAPGGGGQALGHLSASPALAIRPAAAAKTAAAKPAAPSRPGERAASLPATASQLASAPARMATPQRARKNNAGRKKPFTGANELLSVNTFKLKNKSAQPDLRLSAPRADLGRQVSRHRVKVVHISRASRATWAAAANEAAQLDSLNGRAAFLLLPPGPLPDSLHLLITQPSAAADSTPPRRPALRPPYRVVVGLLAGPNFSGVRTTQTARLGTDYGLTLEYCFSTRLRVRAGLLSSQKHYLAASTDYQAPAAWHWYAGTYDLTATCRITELPLDLRYDALSRPTYILFTSLGINSLLMRDERYSYDWTMNGQTFTKSAQVLKGSNHFLSVLNVAVGFEKSLGQRWSAQVEPFWQFPLGGVGAGQVRLTSAGASFSLKYGLLR